MSDDEGPPITDAEGKDAVEKWVFDVEKRILGKSVTGFAYAGKVEVRPGEFRSVMIISFDDGVDFEAAIDYERKQVEMSFLVPRAEETEGRVM